MILVVGATGMVGEMIVDGLLDHGKRVRALVRSPEPAASLGARGAETVLGDLKDRASLDRACAGVDILITTANSASRGGDDNPETVEEQGNRSLVDAARAAGVRHFVFTSALGSALDSPVPFLRGKAIAEQYLTASGPPACPRLTTGRQPDRTTWLTWAEAWARYRRGVRAPRRGRNSRMLRLGETHGSVLPGRQDLIHTLWMSRRHAR
jgi:nucleoside-diphosphate-sugar epimerase